VSWSIPHEPTRTARAAAVSQQGQCEVVRDALGSAPVLAVLGASGELSRVTMAAPTIDTEAEPREVLLGQVIPSALVHTATGTPTTVEIRNGSDVILRATAGTSGALVNFAGAVKALCAPSVGSGGIAIASDAALPPLYIPAWRTAMTETDRLYYVGTSVPYDAPALPGMPQSFGSSGTAPDSFGAGWDVISGYSSGTWLESESGAYGMMVYSTGGHTRLQNQILGFNLSLDDPTFTWWQQPTWVTSDTAGTDLYYSPSEAAALEAGPRGTAARIRLDTNETADAGAWDGDFPVAGGDWIFPRKMTTGQMGNNVPHGLRYSCAQFIPASLTGGAPIYMGIPGPQGPFAQAYKPATITDSEWMDASVLVSDARRWPYYFKNCTTGAWTLNQWLPTQLGVGGFGGPKIGVFTDLKRVYICGAGSGLNSPGWCYLDFTGGAAGHTVSAWSGGMLGIGRYVSGAWSEGDVLGRHFAVFASDQNNDSLVVYDFDAGTSFAIDLGSQGYSHDPNDEWQGMSYDAENSRVLIVRRNTTTWAPYYWSITVPATLTNAAGWVADERTLTLDDAGISSTHFSSPAMSNLYGKSRYLPPLGVCLVPFNQQRMLAFRPSPP
jgi:hypothetical protein